ncbi:MAG: replication initiator protein [Arizlama microvirus]|nr:MAG: replication initiator protein [Arizlama microvirus]
MPCFHPMTAYRARTGRLPNGNWPIVFNVADGYCDMPVVVPCGKCLGCRMEKSRQWGIRCVHEASLHEQNCFITLTYDDEHMPDNASLNKRDIQLFFKRLRKITKAKIGYYQCGEYGEKRLRPHHHACIFGYDFPDKIEIRDKPVKLYASEVLQNIWKNGLCSVGEVTFESAAYVAAYAMKKITGEKALEHYAGRLPEYATMSRNPGIGKNWFKEYRNDVTINDSVIIRPGRVCRPPRYYDNELDKISPSQLKKTKLERKKKAIQLNLNDRERLAIKEKLTKLRQKQLKRSI